MPETRTMPRNVRVHTVDDQIHEFDGRIVSYEGAFLILRNPTDKGYAHAIPAHRITDVIEQPIDVPLGSEEA